MRHEKEYWIFADESVQDGRQFADFCGGCSVPVRIHTDFENLLQLPEAKIGLLKELNWQRLSEQWLNGFPQMIGHFSAELHARQQVQSGLNFKNFTYR